MKTMFAATSPFEILKPMANLRDLRISGGVSITVDARDGASRIASVRERDGYKVRFPRRSNPLEAILINTSGGLASGDDVLQSFTVGESAALTVTTQAAERSYRALDAATTKLNVEAEVGNYATLNWLPQETILFDQTRLSRRIDLDLAPKSRALIAETLVFGRLAMGEHVTTGLFADQWRIRRDGRLIFAENIKLEDEAFQSMCRAAITGGTHVVMTVVLAARDAEDYLMATRAALQASSIECAASSWDGKLIVRALATSTEPVRHLMRSLVPALGGPPLPRVWWT